MERNWLIRTHHKQILGPVSKQKLLEFMQKGSIGAADEVTSGNGYWFSLKEKDLVEKYLHGDIPQSFNPVSESKSVLVHRINRDKTTSLNSAPPNNRITDVAHDENIHLPTADDLEYPDTLEISAVVASSMDETKTNLIVESYPDITLIAHPPVVAASEVNLEKQENLAPADNHEIQLFPDTDDLEYPDMGVANEVKSTPVAAPEAVPVAVAKEVQKEIQEEIPAEVKIETKVEPSKQHAPKPPKPEKKAKVKIEHEPAPHIDPPPIQKRVVSKELEKRNDNYLFVIFFVLLIILFGIFYYYREILNKPLPI